MTGGTGDLNPQFLNFQVVESAANTFTEAEIAIPVLRVGQSSTRAQVIELLRADVFVPPGDGADASQTSYQLTYRSRVTLGTYADDEVLVRETRSNAGAAAAGAYQTWSTKSYNFTDEAGHGVIMGVNRIFLAVQGTSETAAITLGMRILYRFKNVGLNEWFGLAIQQQTS